MPVFATPASLRFRRATVSRPALAVAAAPDADADAAPVTDTETPPTSPITAFASPEADNAVLKARRAYDRDRQRAHQRRERARRELERSAPALPTTASLPAALHAHSREPSRRARLNAGFDAVASAKGEAFRASPVEEIVADVVERAMLARAGGSPILGGAPTEVSLAQIARPAKARKSKAGEFELVPSMPGVIALDDAPTAELDEPWEHISADELDTEPRRPTPPSYAAVAASAA